jgi:hypothetical protein
MVLMALAHLAVERPGWDWILRGIAARVDNGEEEVPEMYENFKSLRREALSD